MDIQLAPGFQREFPKILGKVLDDLSQMLDVEFDIDPGELQVRPLAEAYAEAGEGVIACRSIFARKVNGIGGMLLPQATADAMSRAMMMMDPAGPDDAFDCEGLVKEAMEELFNIFIGSWNTASSPDFRLGSGTEERSVELLSTAIPMPEAAGVLPCTLHYPLTIHGCPGFLDIFLPIQAVHGREVAGFVTPTEFHPQVGGEATPAPAEAPAPRERYDGPLRPVVFLDYTGEVIPWIRERAALAGHRCLLSDGVDPGLFGEDSPPPAAAILLGVDLQLLAQCEDVQVVEIRPATAVASA